MQLDTLTAALRQRYFHLSSQAKLQNSPILRVLESHQQSVHRSTTEVLGGPVLPVHQQHQQHSYLSSAGILGENVHPGQDVEIPASLESPMRAQFPLGGGFSSLRGVFPTRGNGGDYAHNNTAHDLGERADLGIVGAVNASLNVGERVDLYEPAMHSIGDDMNSEFFILPPPVPLWRGGLSVRPGGSLQVMKQESQMTLVSVEACRWSNVTRIK